MNSLFHSNFFLGINHSRPSPVFSTHSKFSLKFTEFTNASVQGFLLIEDYCTFSVCFPTR